MKKSKVISIGRIEFIKEHSAGSHYTCQIQIKNLKPLIEGNNKIGFYRGYKPYLKRNDRVEIIQNFGWRTFFISKYDFRKGEQNERTYKLV